MSWKRERGEENLKVILERRETGGDRGEKKEREGRFRERRHLRMEVKSKQRHTNGTSSEDGEE